MQKNNGTISSSFGIAVGVADWEAPRIYQLSFSKHGIPSNREWVCPWLSTPISLFQAASLTQSGFWLRWDTWLISSSAQDSIFYQRPALKDECLSKYVFRYKVF